MRGIDPLSLYAVWEQKPDILELLLANGADPDAKDEAGWSLLHYTAVSGYADMTRHLLNKSANPNVKENQWSRTPLHWAAERDHKSVVEMLISHGADVNTRDYDGRTALSLSKEGGHAEIVELLRKHGAKE